MKDPAFIVNPARHRERMIMAFCDLARKKYDQGQREHGGDLQKKSQIKLLLEIRDEAIDTFIYAQTAIDKFDAE